MADIPAVLEKTDFEALSEDVQNYFTEKDGKYYPNFSQSNIEKLAVGLRNNRDTILEEKRQIETELKAYKELGTTEDIQAKLDEASKGQPKKIQEVEEQFKTQIEEIKSQAAKQITAKEQSFASREDSLMKTIRKSLLGSEVSKAIVDNGGNPKLLAPAVERALRLQEVQTADGGIEFVVEVLDNEGKPRMANALGERLSVADYVAELQKDKDYAGAFTANNGGGTGGSNNQNTNHQHNGVVRITDQAALNASVEDIASGKVKVID